MQELKPGTALRDGTYRIEKILGQGGFGITYLATDITLEKLVAIKEFFHKNYCDRVDTTIQVTVGNQSTSDLVERYRSKFLKEARNIAKFDNPYIVKIHAAFEENNTAYYVMDYIDGVSLSEKIKQEGPLSEEKSIEYLSKIGEALEYIHDHHVNHLDVKPANIMIRKQDDTPILIDFGLSKQYDDNGNQTSTTPLGISNGFAPLEQYKPKGIEEFSPQTDVYSLAATLFYLLSGKVPPHASDLIDEELKFPDSISPQVRPVITKAMSVGKSKRQKTVKDFINELREIKNKKKSKGLKHYKESNSPSYKEQDDHQRLKFKCRKTFIQIAKLSNKLKLHFSKKPNFLIIGFILLTICLIFFLVFYHINNSSLNRIPGKKDNIIRLSTPLTKPIKEDYNTSKQEINAFLAKFSGTQNGYTWIDLALPSGTLWANCNIGSKYSNQYGNYYNWYTTNAKNKDLAASEWGDAWTIPTYEQMKELEEQCKWEWTTIDGINGYKIYGLNKKFIFLPAGGWFLDNELNFEGTDGHYWTSSIEDGWGQELWIGQGAKAFIGPRTKSAKINVRPVMKKSKYELQNQTPLNQR